VLPGGGAAKDSLGAVLLPVMVNQLKKRIGTTHSRKRVVTLLAGLQYESKQNLTVLKRCFGSTDKLAL
jgi:hypothetical protein